MAKTINDAHLSLAYRLGSSSVPGSANELSKRLNWFKKAIEIVCITERPLWFLKQTKYDSTLADVSTYALASEIRLVLEVKVDGYKYTKVPQDEIYRRYEVPTAPVPILPSYQSRSYYEWGSSIVLIPTPSAVGTNNIELRSVVKPTLPTLSTSSIVVPDEYEDVLVSYAEGRYWSAAHKRAKAADAFAEFDDWVARLKSEDVRHRIQEEIEQK